MNKFDLIAVDLDDTLLTSELTISVNDREALSRVQQRGILIVLATGRGPEGMKRFWKILELDRMPSYAIGYNGALVVKTNTVEEIFRFELSSEMAQLVVNHCHQKNFAVQTYRDGQIKVSRENDWTHHDSYLTGLPNVVVDEDELINPAPIKLVIPGEPELLPHLKQELKTLLAERADVVISKPYFLEVLPPGVNKGRSLEKLCQLLNIPAQRVMALGDAMNDAEMIEWAGFGVAMANAVERVKTLAKAVTERDHNNGGVAEALNRWVH